MSEANMSTHDNKEQQRFNLEQARQIAKEYAEPHSMIDSGNLFFALGEFVKAYDVLNLELINERKKTRRLKELLTKSREVLSDYWFSYDEYDSYNNPEVIEICKKIDKELEAIDNEGE